ncbi:strictosidine synthase-like 5-like protein [Tanacetum coccineum]
MISPQWMRCHRYYLQGDKKGSVDVFANNLPGLPDNVRYDGDGHYWIAQPWDYSAYFKCTQAYSFVRNIFAFTLKHLHKMPHLTKFGGVLVLDLKGKPVGGYYDEEWEMTSCGVKIGNYLYLGSVTKPYILRIDLLQNPLTVAAS